MQALSSAARQTEARHAFSLRLLAAEPMARLPYLSCLPFQEALALAQPFLSQPDGELRAQAVAAVVGAGGTRLPACPPSWISAARVKTSRTPCGWPC